MKYGFHDPQAWRLLEESSENPNWALAIEESVAKSVADGQVPNTLRFWRTKNTIIIGRFQCPASEVEIDSCLKNETAIARRFTGGGATYHDVGNLNFALSVHKNPLRNSNLCEFFGTVGLTVVRCLRRLGLPAEYKKMSVFISGRKVCGLAGCLVKEAVFVHGSLLVSSDLGILCSVLNLNKDKPKTKFVPSTITQVTTIENELAREIQLPEIQAAFRTTFEEQFGAMLGRDQFTMIEAKLAQELFEQKYSSPAWMFTTCALCRKKCANLSRLKKFVSLA